MQRIISLGSNLSSVIKQCSDALELIYDFGCPKEVWVCLSFEAYVSPSVLVATVAFYFHLRQIAGSSLRLTVRGNNNFAARMDFFKLIEFPYVEYFSRHDETGRFTPITHFKKEGEIYSFCRSVVKILENQGAIAKDLTGTFDYALNEVLGNVFTHAMSPYGAVAIMMTKPKRQQLELCIADSGIGIPDSLRENPLYQHLGDGECLIKSLDFKVTSGNGQGVGLFHTRRLVEANGGELTIYTKSGTGLSLKNGQMSLFQNHTWHGTLINISLNTGNIVNLGDIFGDKIPGLVQDYIMDGTLW